MKLRHASFFSGIGGQDLAAQWMGWENVLQCEYNPFCQRVLKHYWPNATLYGDITQTDFTPHANTIDVLFGGFPCQPYSVSGKRKGTKDLRDGWPHMYRGICEIKPRWVVAENVRGLISWDEGILFEKVQADLEAAGYEVQSFLLPAAGKGAPHERYRTFIVAYAHNFRWTARSREVNNGGDDIALQNSPKRTKVLTQFERCDIRGINPHTGLQGHQQLDAAAEPSQPGHFAWPLGKGWDNWPTQSPILCGDDGIPGTLDFAAVFTGIDKPRKPITLSKWRRESIAAYGNAVVPELVHDIYKTIALYETLNNPK